MKINTTHVSIRVFIEDAMTQDPLEIVKEIIDESNSSIVDETNPTGITYKNRLIKLKNSSQSSQSEIECVFNEDGKISVHKMENFLDSLYNKCVRQKFVVKLLIYKSPDSHLYEKLFCNHVDQYPNENQKFIDEQYPDNEWYTILKK